MGSTAVPGLDAKPVIDLMAGVRDVRNAGRCIRPLEEIGYSYWAENPNPDRMLFVRFADAGRILRTHNLHVVEVGETSGTAGSCSGITSARTRRRPGNTHVSNMSSPNASATTARRTPKPRRTSSWRRWSVRGLRESRDAERSIRGRETDVSFRAVLSRCIIRSCNVP